MSHLQKDNETRELGRRLMQPVVRRRLNSMPVLQKKSSEGLAATEFQLDARGAAGCRFLSEAAKDLPDLLQGTPARHDARPLLGFLEDQSRPQQVTARSFAQLVGEGAGSWPRDVSPACLRAS